MLDSTKKESHNITAQKIRLFIKHFFRKLYILCRVVSWSPHEKDGPKHNDVGAGQALAPKSHLVI